MKLAEALLQRADLQQDLSQLQSRIEENLLIQEGDEPAENAVELMQRYDTQVARLGALICRINRTNTSTAFSDTETIADAMARRDVLGRRLTAYRAIYSEAQPTQTRYSANEIRLIRCVDVREIQKKINAVCKEYRALDSELQALNWQTELLD